MFRKLPLLYKIAAAVPVVGIGVLCYQQFYNKPQPIQINQQSLSPIIAQSNVHTNQIQNSIQKQETTVSIAQKQQISTSGQNKADSTPKNTIQQHAAQDSNKVQNKSEQKQQTTNQQTQKSKKQSEQQNSIQNVQAMATSQQNSMPSDQHRSPQQQQAKKEAVKKIKINKFSQIPLIDKFDGLEKYPYLMIVLDPGYTSMFQNELLSKITKTINKRSNTAPLSIYRINSRNKQVLAAFQKQFSVKIRQEDIYLLKNPYEGKFVNVDFDMFLKYDRIPAIYLSQLKSALNAQQLKNYMTKMTPNDTYLLFTVDSASPAADLDQRKFVAKHIQLELGAHAYENIKLCLADHKLAQEAGIISFQAKPNSLHLIRKGNQFTYKPPNRWIYENKPYHVMESIILQDKERNILLPRYLSKIQTFTSLRLDSPYICLINIDRNRINPKQERQILKVIGQLKASKKYPMVSFVLKFGQTQFRGTQEDPFSNKKWCLKLAHVSEMDKQENMLQVKNEEQRKNVGVNQKDWLRSSNQYLFKQPQITEEGITNFFDRVLEGGEPQYYKSQGKFKLGLVDKVTGQTFNQIIFGQSQAKKSHLVFEYSDYCQACQALSPIIDYFADVCSKFPQLGVKVHALNCDKNKVKGQPYSPYTPNLYYYSKNWKNRSPIRYPILEYIKHSNIWGIYDFCMITDQLNKIDIDKFEDHIKKIMDSKVKISDF